MGEPFEWPIRVYIEDTDAGGIVYYPNYFKFMERARTEFMRSLDFGKDSIFSADLMFVVHSLNAEYLKPARLDDALIATVEVLKFGHAFMLMEQKIYRSGNEGILMDLLTRAEIKLACVDKQSIKPRRIPAEIRQAITAKVVSNND
jgi:tol-pal system-associated acyl-CoA thioesterase